MSSKLRCALASVSESHQFRLVSSTGTPAYVTDEEFRIVGFNRAAEECLGYKESEVLGRRCHQVLCGTDTFGNPYCMRGCPIARTVRQGLPIFPFEIGVRKSSGDRFSTEISIMVLPGSNGADAHLIHLLRPASGHHVPFEEAGDGPLTRRETQILRFIACGRVVKEISGSLGISVATARVHVRNAIRKLGVHSQLEAVAEAFRNRAI